MKKLLNIASKLQQVKASITGFMNKGFHYVKQFIQEGKNERLFRLGYSVLITCLLLSFQFVALAANTITCTTVQNGKNAVITSIMSPWDQNEDMDFNDPATSNTSIVEIQSVIRSIETINGMLSRKMTVNLTKKIAGAAVVTISQAPDVNGISAPPQLINFNAYMDLFCMSIPGHLLDGAFLYNGFHPGDAFPIALKIIDTQTGNPHPGITGTAMLTIIGNGFTFNGGGTIQTVNFNNGVATVTLNALLPNSSSCFFKISDDASPGSIGGTNILNPAMISLTSPPLSSSVTTVNVSCGSLNSGSATVSVTGGTSPYQYSCSPGVINSNNPSFPGLAAGNYTATATDFYGVTSTVSFTILPPPALTIDATVIQPTCAPNGKGTIQVSVAGSSSPINYIWNNGSTSASRTNLSAGNYTVTATNLSGCTGSKSFKLASTNKTPIITCPDDIVAGTETGKDYALVSFLVDVTDDCMGNINLSIFPPSGSAFNKGITLVTCKATDLNGLTSTCSFNVIVKDEEAPVAKISDKTVALGSNGTVTLTPVLLNDSSTDNCGIMSRQIAPSVLTSLNIGTTPVTFTVTDGNNYYWVVNKNKVTYFNNNDVLLKTLTTQGNTSIIVTHDGGFILIDKDRVRLYAANGTLKSTIFTTGAVQVILTGNGGFIVVDDGRVRKYDKNGNLQSTIFTTGEVKVIQNPCDGGFIVIDAGRVRKYDKDGNLQSTIFTTGNVTVILTPDCGFIVIDDGRVRKYDKDGNLQSTIFTTGAVQVIQTPCDEGFIVVDDGRVRKYDKNGNLQSTIFTTGTVTIIQTLPCGFIVIDDGRVRKYDGNGNLQSTIFTTGVVKVITTSDGGFLVIDDGRVRKYDKDGNLQSTIFTTGAVKVIQTPCDNGFIIIDDGRVRKYDKDGNLQSTIFTTGTVTVILMPAPACGFIVIDDGRIRKYDQNGNLQSTIFTTGVVKVIPTGNGGFIVVDEGRVRLYDKDGNLKSTIFTSGQVQVIETPCDEGFIVIDDGRVRKYDKDGNLQSTVFTTGKVTVTLIPAPGCGYIVQDDGRVRKYDQNGSLQSTIFTNGDVQVIPTGDGGFIVIDDGRVRKYDKDGNLQSTSFTTGKVTVIPGANGEYKIIDDGRVRVYDKDSNLTSTIFTIGKTSVYKNYSLSSSLTASVIIANPVVLAGSTQDVACKGAKTGKITLTVSGNTSPYTFLWSNGKTTKNLTSLTAGTYTCTVTNKNGITNSITCVISQPDALVITTSKTTVKCGGSGAGTATAVASGGTAPYLYAWNTVPVKTGSTATGLFAGTYIVTVTDANGCTKTKSLTIIQNPVLTIAVQPSFDHATAVPAGGVGPYTYKWFTVPVQTNSTATGMTCGTTYKVKVTDSKGCTAEHTFTTLACPRLVESDQSDKPEVNVFPNPTSGLVNIAIKNAPAPDYSVDLIDAIGRIVYSSSGLFDGGLQKQLDLSVFSDGIYWLRITGDNKIAVTKVVLQKNR